MSNRRRPNIARAAEREARNMRVNGSAPALVRPHFTGVPDDRWSDLPPAQYPPDTVAFIRQALALGEDLKRVKGYRCDACSAVLATIDRHPGFSPDVIDHKQIGGRCAGAFLSFGYPDDPPPGTPSHEWRRPSERELMDLPDAFIDHVLRGGLILDLNRDADPAARP